jgi:hypothetical protein
MVADAALDAAPAESLLAHARRDHQNARDDDDGGGCRRRSGKVRDEQDHAIILTPDLSNRVRRGPDITADSPHTRCRSSSGPVSP